MQTTSLRRFGAAATLAAVSLATVFASVTAMADTTKPLLFKIVTVKDDVIVAVPPDEAGVPRPDAAAIGQALAAKGALTFWQYATRKAADGALEMAPAPRSACWRTTACAWSPTHQRCGLCRCRSGAGLAGPALVGLKKPKGAKPGCFFMKPLLKRFLSQPHRRLLNGAPADGLAAPAGFAPPAACKSGGGGRWRCWH